MSCESVIQVPYIISHARISELNLIKLFKISFREICEASYDIIKNYDCLLPQTENRNI